jgi:ATP-dependent protease Clp ATPase subunit
MMLPRRDDDGASLQCSFCGNLRTKLICSPSHIPKRSYICDECVTLCALILEDDRNASDVPVLKAESDEPPPS